jgi:hypothetical protein
LYSTPIARQLKSDHGDNCRITWAVSSKCKNILLNNPYIDNLWIIELQNFTELSKVWEETLDIATKKKNSGEYDEIIIPQIIDENKSYYTGSIRELTLKSYKDKFNVPLTPVLNLTTEEIKNVGDFICDNGIINYKNIILFECEPQSNQFDITPVDAVKISKKILTSNPDTCFIITSSEKINSSDPRIIDGSILTLRENAELIKYCNLLLGCSSGITWLSRSSWCIDHKINTVQFLKTKTIWFNSLLKDHAKFNFDSSNILELYNPSFSDIEKCLINILANGFTSSKILFQKSTPKSNTFYSYLLRYYLCNKNFKFALNLFKSNFKKNCFNLTFWSSNIYFPLLCSIIITYNYFKSFKT